jgi:hypothetical protein
VTNWPGNETFVTGWPGRRFGGGIGRKIHHIELRNNGREEWGTPGLKPALFFAAVFTGLKRLLKRSSSLLCKNHRG